MFYSGFLKKVLEKFYFNVLEVTEGFFNHIKGSTGNLSPTRRHASRRINMLFARRSSVDESEDAIS